MNEMNKTGKSSEEQDLLVRDLKESLADIIQDTSEVIKELIETIDVTIKDEENRVETTAIINEILSDFKSSIKSVENKILSENRTSNFSKEEE